MCLVTWSNTPMLLLFLWIVVGFVCALLGRLKDVRAVDSPPTVKHTPNSLSTSCFVPPMSDNAAPLKSEESLEGRAGFPRAAKAEKQHFFTLREKDSVRAASLFTVQVQQCHNTQRSGLTRTLGIQPTLHRRLAACSCLPFHSSVLPFYTSNMFPTGIWVLRKKSRQLSFKEILTGTYFLTKLWNKDAGPREASCRPLRK